VLYAAVNVREVLKRKSGLEPTVTAATEGRKKKSDASENALAA